jgi:nitrate/nitrite transporter NarK
MVGAMTRKNQVTTFVPKSARQQGWHAALCASRIARVVLPFAMGYFRSYLFRTINGLITDWLVQKFGLNGITPGLLATIYFPAFALAQLLHGPLVDRYGSRRVQSIDLGSGAVASIVPPIGMALPVVAWRGVFLVLSIATIAIVALVFLLVPKSRMVKYFHVDWNRNIVITSFKPARGRPALNKN